MYSQLNERLLEAIREQLPEGTNLALVLMNILSLEKGAAYRRLNGEVMFTLEEVAKISKKLGISLDKVIGGSKMPEDNRWTFVDVHMLHPSYSSKYMEQYEKKLKVSLEILQNAQNRSKGIFRCATIQIPYYFVIPYPNLVMFRHYKRAYLFDGINPSFCFSDMPVSLELHAMEKQLLKRCFEIPKNLLILDRNAFSVMVKDIGYFYQRRLITKDKLALLRGELLDLLTTVEQITTTGKLSTGAEMLIYLSDVSLDSTYIHIESEAFENSLQFAYFVDTLSFNNPLICRMQKDWIESLKRYSTLITQTGEMQRADFFNAQRELIEAL